MRPEGWGEAEGLGRERRIYIYMGGGWRIATGVYVVDWSHTGSVSPGVRFKQEPSYNRTGQHPVRTRKQAHVPLVWIKGRTKHGRPFR